MWENRILILNMDDFDKHAQVDAVQVAMFIEKKLDEVTREGWEPYHVTDDDDMTVVVWMKRYVIE